MGAFLYSIVMIYTILSIPFGATALYFFCASQIQNKCLREMTKEEKKEFGILEDDVKILDSDRAGVYLGTMAVCWYLGYPIIKLHNLLTK